MSNLKLSPNSKNMVSFSNITLRIQTFRQYKFIRSIEPSQKLGQSWHFVIRCISKWHISHSAVSWSRTPRPQIIKDLVFMSGYSSMALDTPTPYIHTKFHEWTSLADHAHKNIIWSLSRVNHLFAIPLTRTFQGTLLNTGETWKKWLWLKVIWNA